ncbi:hypothetical protein GCM10027570_44160 [Streptomonospora sediminis]
MGYHLLGRAPVNGRDCTVCRASVRLTARWRAERVAAPVIVGQPAALVPTDGPGPPRIARSAPTAVPVGQVTNRSCQARAEVSVREATWSMTTRSAAASSGARS